MPLLALQFKATLENLSAVRPLKDVQWCLKVKCTGCGEVHEKNIFVSPEEEHELPSNSRVSTNFYMKCRLCSREHTIDVKTPYGEFKSENEGKFATLVTFDFRGLEPVAWIPQSDGFLAEGTTGTQFDLDMSEGDFCEFDEATNESVRCHEIQHQFIKVK
eukprot:TRINITY_DN17027_c0_g1::TRINITY_DN17027_c0_g1_i1::g.20965::m.20965 TRINITY_DN17027_c0_g1::TRINITY_DN17027_c0_g1_i1::g.20965  ORF type:complete len:160 (+),score=11.37,sp/Q498R7/CA123_RAT/42.86/3e-34,DUF866/PF05907.8/2.5e-43 TRINITY_DN17027_c0_g1_i1:78-557(+)